MKIDKWARAVTSCLLCGAIASGMLLPEVSAEAINVTTETIAAPAQWEYLWNGAFLNDRASFTMKLNDWELATEYGKPAVITAGTNGSGAQYDAGGADWWSSRVRISLESAADPAYAELGFLSEDEAIAVRISKGNNGSVIELIDGGETVAVLGTAPTADSVFDVITDNTRDGESLRFHITGDKGFESHCSVSGLPDSVRAVLADTRSLQFSSSSAVVFSDLYLYDLKNPFEGDPAAALAFLESNIARAMSMNKGIFHDGRIFNLPDTVGNYNASWLRDPVLWSLYATDYYPQDVMINDFEITMENARESDGWLPDHVYTNGAIAMAAGDLHAQIADANLDMAQLAALMFNVLLSRMEPAEAQAFFDKWEATLMRALNCLPVDANGLVYNDPAILRSPIGWNDVVAKTGSLMSESVLLWKAYTVLADLQDIYGEGGDASRAKAAQIEDALVSTFYNEEYGLLNSATGDCNQPDIMGSCFAVSLGFPLEQEVKDSIAAYLCDNYDGLTQFGMVRMLPPGEYWKRLIAGCPQGMYMNGGYWPLVSVLFIDTIKEYSPELARRTLDNLIAYYATHGYYEWINGGNDQRVNDFMCSVMMPISLAQELLTTAVESVDVSGDETLKTSMTGEYAVTVSPGDATVRSIEWEIDGVTVGEGDSLSHRFDKAGTYTVTVRVTDTSGATASADLAVTVTDFDKGTVALSMPRIDAKEGDIVAVPVSVAPGSALTSCDLRLRFDPALLAPVACGEGDSLYALPGAVWDGGLIASGATDGSVTVSMARGKAIDDGGVLFTLQFRALKTIDTPVELGTDVLDCRVAAEQPGLTKRAVAKMTYTGAAGPAPTTGAPTGGTTSAATSASGTDSPSTGGRAPLFACLTAALSGGLLLSARRKRGARS